MAQAAVCDPDSKPTPAQAAPAHDISRLIDEPDIGTISLLGFLLGSATTLGTSTIYRRYFMRLTSAVWITPNILRREPWITGVVTSCVAWAMVITFASTIHRDLAGVDRSSSGTYCTQAFSRVSQKYDPHHPHGGRRGDPLLSSPLNATLHSKRISASLHKRTPTKHSHGSKNKSTADDSNASSSSVTNTDGSSRSCSARTIAGGRVAAQRVTCPLRWYVPGRVSYTRARGRRTVAGDRLCSSKRRLKRRLKRRRRGGHLACRYGHRDARRITYKKRHRAAQEAAREEEPEAELEVFEPEPEPERKGILDRIFRRGK